MKFFIRSPLSKADEIMASTLIFVGAEDQRVLPETQGIPLYKAIKGNQKAATTLYNYPGTYHDDQTSNSIIR